MKRFILTLIISMCVFAGFAQRFFNLSADEVKIDNQRLPVFTYIYDLGPSYADSLYTVSIDYPEFIPMTAADIRRYQAITTDSLPALPAVSSSLNIARKKGQLDISFVPLVFRDGRYMKLVSFKLTVKGRALPRGTRAAAATAAASTNGRYAGHSVLRSGTWAKISVSASGVHQLTEAVVRKAGFSDLSKVKIYGYGGALQPETLNGDYLTTTDDLKEVPTCTVNGRRLFYAQGPVSWSDTGVRTRNPYSDKGYYFITDDGTEPATVDSAAFVASCYPSDNDYNGLYEVDNYSWEHSGFHGGRNLYDSKLLEQGVKNDYTIDALSGSAGGTVTVALSAYSVSGSSNAEISVNDSVVGTVAVPRVALSDYDGGNSGQATFRVANLTSATKVTVTNTSSNPMRLDYVAVHTDTPRQAPQLSSAAIPAAEYVYNITNQDHHADSSVDMVILIPTSQLYRDQAERLKKLHEDHDGLTVRIVPADELYNEFSSGTPDATACRRYLKMLYDRATTDAEMPRYLLLFGDAVWDNRMLTPECRGLNPDNFLLCYEGENSFSQVNCFVSDDFFCMLDDNEAIGTGSSYRGKPDVAVGRLSARTWDQAKILVDKTESYLTNKETGSWKNTFVVMGDDGNNNVHMEAADAVAGVVQKLQPAIDVKKVMWDAYERVSSSTGFSYPGATAAIKKYMNSGALVLNYNGHGDARTISHEKVLTISDYVDNACRRLPLWVTASCDISPFDGVGDNIGEAAMYNANGGAVAFYGTTRTVYTGQNLIMNKAFTKYLFTKAADGRHNTIGEAARLAKVELVTPSAGTSTDYSMNKLHYVLLGDPALRLAYPDEGVVIDSINGEAFSSAASTTLKAGQKVRIAGHVVAGGQPADDFSGTLTATVYDAATQVTCRLNKPNTATDHEGSDKAYVFTDRQTVVFNGSDSVRNGRFAINFVVPKDISYSSGSARLSFYAVNADGSREYNGMTENICLNGSETFKRDSVGPNIYCYLNSSSFSNGGNVNTTPYFYAELNDEDGINASGSGVGHDMQIIIDGDAASTYVVNDYFTYDFGSYQRGKVGYSLPELTPGVHKLQFRAWDILNNVSVAELTFNVVKDLSPNLVSVDCTKNPATSSTSFIIVHDRIGSALEVGVEVFDMAGRRLWTYADSGQQTGNAVTVDWDLTTTDGRRLDTGVYLYRVTARCAGGEKCSQTKKLIVIK